MNQLEKELTAWQFSCKTMYNNYPVSMFFYKIIGLTGIWITFPVSEIAAALVCLWMFIRTYKKDDVFIKNND